MMLDVKPQSRIGVRRSKTHGQHVARLGALHVEWAGLRVRPGGDLLAPPVAAVSVDGQGNDRVPSATRSTGFVRAEGGMEASRLEAVYRQARRPLPPAQTAGRSSKL